MKIIENQNFPHERDLYASDGLYLKNCRFDGEEDGESALKENRNVKLEGCFMNLRYPLWHDKNVELISVEMTQNCRAALWYTRDVEISSSALMGIKALRECENVRMRDTKIVSPEFGWKSRNVTVENSSIESEYAFLLASDLNLSRVRFKGKYSFQYVENALFETCLFDTKDAFWHTKNVTVKNCTVKGEYLGWYSENLTFIDCTIIGTQPLCYCKGLKLVNCTMQDADLSFEYSEVDADVKGEILSVKNPLAGTISCDGIGELIYTDDSVYPCECKIDIRK